MCEHLFTDNQPRLTMSASLQTPVLRRTRALLRSPWLRPLGEEPAINDVLGQLNPTWSLSEIRARVLRRVPETADTTTLVLGVNRLWPGFAAGQHVGVAVEIDGVRHHRTYSLSSAPDGGREVAITVKRPNGGRVSTHLNDATVPGDVLILSAPRGDFVLPQALPPHVLMLSAGSGITPVMSMLRDLAAREARPAVTFLHCCRSAADAIFERELRDLAARWPELNLICVHTATQGRLTPRTLARLVPEFAQLPTYLCGPAAFMATIEALYQERGAAANLKLERFAAPQVKSNGVTAQVSCSRSGTAFTAETAGALLPQAEAAGLAPKSGCRIGICQTCKCRKHSGTVQNLLTGEISAEPGEMIQLCISAPRSDLDLDL